MNYYTYDIISIIIKYIIMKYISGGCCGLSDSGQADFVAVDVDVVVPTTYLGSVIYIYVIW